MNFTLDEQQSLIRESVARFVTDHFDLGRYRAAIREIAPVDKAVWARFAELGWLALPFDEQDGGFGGGPVETMVLMEEFGKGLIREPWLATVVLGGGFLKRAGDALRGQYLPLLMAGQLQLAFAADEYGRLSDPTGCQLRAEREAEGWRLNGVKCLVLNGDQADCLVVLARSQGHSGDRQGLTLLLVDANAEGVRRQPHRLVDGRQAAEIHFADVWVPAEALIGEAGAALPLVEAVRREAILALAAEAQGALSVLLESTVEYAKTRKQFGVPIGSFQALQHRMADMFMLCEQNRSLLLAATLKVAEGHDDADRAVHALKAQLGRAGRKVAQEAIQIHGGIGMTDELAVGHYFKRLIGVDALFGTADEHLAALAGLA